jgi:hypothetical protein
MGRKLKNKLEDKIKKIENYGLFYANNYLRMK